MKAWAIGHSIRIKVYIITLILDWAWKKTNKIKDDQVTNERLLAELNTIKLDVNL